MNLEAKGRMHVIHESVQISDRFRKREFVIEMGAESRYPQLVMFQLTGDRCEQIDGLEIGDEVAIEFSLRGREWTSPKGETRYFNSLESWAVRCPDRVAEQKQAYEEGKNQATAESGEQAPPIDENISF